MSRHRSWLAALLLAAAWGAGHPRAAAATPATPADDSFPPVSDADRQLTALPGQPGAAAIVLSKKGELLMAGYGLQAGAQLSYLRVEVRLKILTDAGRGNGEIVIAHGDGARLQHFQGRTVLPDGRVIPVPEGAQFVRRSSRARRTFVTAVAFPAVEPGAILDYRYELSYDSIFVFEPWYFSEEIPVRHAEVTFKTSPQLQVMVWSRSFGKEKIGISTEKTASGYITRGWADGLAAVPDEPLGLPYGDLAAQMLLLPTAMTDGWKNLHLLESWPKVCEIFAKGYDAVRRRDGGVAARAREIAGAGSPRSPRAKAEALYRFVRDRVATLPAPGVDVTAGASLAGVLAAERGNHAEKALLLQAMLAAVGIDSQPVWAGDRDRGAIDLKLPNPSWFDTVLVRVEIDGAPAFLDPADPTLAFGRLSAGYEGGRALVFDPKNPQEIVLPEAPFDHNLRRAEIALTLDEQGRLAGEGTLTLTGQAARERIGWQGDAAKTAEAWQGWLEGRFRDFRVSGVAVADSVDEGKVTVRWTLAQRAEEALGDEVSLVASAPLGPLAQPLVEPAASRRTPWRLDYAGREEVELRLRWPAGWKPASLPDEKGVVNAVGRLTVGIERQEGENALVYRRRVDLPRREAKGTRDYEPLRSFFGDVEKHDAQKLVLVRR